MVPTSSQPAAPIRVVHVITGLRTGGAETALLRLVQGGPSSRIEHIIVSLSGRGDLAEALEAAGGAVITPNLRAPRSVLACLSRIRAWRPNVIQGWMVHGNLAAWLIHVFGARKAALAWNLRMPFTGIDREKARTRWLTRAIASVSSRVDLLLANAQSTLHDHLAIGYRPRTSAVIPNGFEPAAYASDPAGRADLRAAWAVPKDAILFGLVGRYHPAKGHDIFLRAAAHIRERFPHARFALVGADTDTSTDLGALLDTLGLRDRVLRLGRRTDVAPVMQALDVVCIPSYYESFPNVLGEAMSSARPVIATDVSDVASIMGGAGRLIPISDWEALASAMAGMLETGSEARAQMGELGRARVMEHYTLAATVERYYEHYVRLAIQARSPLPSQP